MKIADFIVKVRANLNMSLREFAKLIGVSHNAVWLWEKGKTKPKDIYIAIIKRFDHE